MRSILKGSSVLIGVDCQLKFQFSSDINTIDSFLEYLNLWVVSEPTANKDHKKVSHGSTEGSEFSKGCRIS